MTRKLLLALTLGSVLAVPMSHAYADGEDSKKPEQPQFVADGEDTKKPEQAQLVADGEDTKKPEQPQMS